MREFSRTVRLQWIGASGEPARPTARYPHCDCRACVIRSGRRETASRAPDCAASLRRTIPTRKRADQRNRACNPSCSTRFRWHLSPPPSSRSRPANPVGLRRRRAWPDAVRSGMSESRREPGLPRSSRAGHQRSPGEQVIYRQDRSSRERDSGASEICPGVSSEWRSEWRSATKRAGSHCRTSPS